MPKESLTLNFLNASIAWPIKIIRVKRYWIAATDTFSSHFYATSDGLATPPKSTSTAARKPLVQHPRPSAALMALEHEVGHGHQPEQIYMCPWSVQERSSRQEEKHRPSELEQNHKVINLHWRPGVFCQLMLLDLSSVASEGYTNKKTTSHQAWNQSPWSSMPDPYALHSIKVLKFWNRSFYEFLVVLT